MARDMVLPCHSGAAAGRTRKPRPGEPFQGISRQMDSPVVGSGFFAEFILGPTKGRTRGLRPRTSLWHAAALLLLLLWSGFALAAEPSYPALTGRVVDGANLLAPDIRQRLADKLKAHEDKTSDQVVVATVPSLQDVTIEDFANGLFRHWKLGQKAKNNGALLIVAPKERKVRIEVGYGLEGALTDALSKVIITTAIAPKFKTGDFAGGIDAGVDAILTILAGDAEEWQRRAEVRSDESSLGEDIAVIIAMVLVFLFIVAFLRGLSQHRQPLRRRQACQLDANLIADAHRHRLGRNRRRH